MTKQIHITLVYHTQPYQQLKYHTPYALQKRRLFTHKNDFVLIKHNTHFVGVCTPTHKKSHMGTKK